MHAGDLTGAVAPTGPPLGLEDPLVEGDVPVPDRAAWPLDGEADGSVVAGARASAQAVVPVAAGVDVPAALTIEDEALLGAATPLAGVPAGRRMGRPDGRVIVAEAAPRERGGRDALGELHAALGADTGIAGVGVGDADLRQRGELLTHILLGRHGRGVERLAHLGHDFGRRGLLLGVRLLLARTHVLLGRGGRGVTELLAHVGCGGLHVLHGLFGRGVVDTLIARRARGEQESGRAGRHDGKERLRPRHR